MRSSAPSNLEKFVIKVYHHIKYFSTMRIYMVLNFIFLNTFFGGIINV